MTDNCVFKFVPWDVPDLSTLRESVVYKLRAMLNKGLPLNRTQKNWITAKVNSNTYFKNAVPLQGWAFKFTDVLKKFVVKKDGMCIEIYGIDKTSVRDYLGGRIEYIIEVK